MKRKHASLSKRIFLIFSVVMVILLVVVSIVSYFYTYGVVLQKTQDALQLSMTQHEATINQRINRLDEISLTPANDRQLYQMLRQKNKDTAAENVTQQNLANYFIKNVYLPLRYNFTDVEYAFYIPDSVEAAGIYEKAGAGAGRVMQPWKYAEEQAWYEKTLRAKGALHWEISPEEAVLSATRLVQGFFQPYGITRYGIVQIELPLSELFAPVLESARTLPADFFLVSPAREIFSLTGKDTALEGYLVSQPLVRHQLQDVTIDGVKYLNSSIQLENKWYLISITPYRVITQEAQKILPLYLIILLGAVVLVLAISRYVSQYISRPIVKLSNTMRSVQERRNLGQSPAHSSDITELVELYDSFTFMANRINELLAKTYSQGVAVKEAEIRALQAQINPHFLYNTLDSIGWAVMDTGNTEIPTMISYLSDMLRYGLKDYDELSPIAEEIKIVKQYIAIQEFSYGLTIGLVEEFEVLEDVFRLPKMTLQPIVENAILHGILKSGDRKGVIVLRAFVRNKHLIVQVESQHPADIPHMYSIIDESIKTDSHGLRNINSRLTILYGEEYHLRFFPSDSGGLVVEITLPNSEPNSELNSENFFN